MRRAKRPLNPVAVKKADAQLAAKTGGRPLTNDPKDAKLRKEWMDAYIAEAGPDSYVDSSKQKPVDQTEGTCTEEENWIELEYLYCDGTGVKDAHYTVTDNATGTVAADGYLDGDGYAMCSLPVACTDVSYNFDKDPDPGEYLKQPIPNPEQAKVKPGWFERMSDGIVAAASWFWGAIQGDFNEDQTIGQIVTNTAITMIPLVDQAGDIRDVAANLKFLIWDKRYNDKWVWIALVLTLVGLIPVLGSAAKGILRSIEHGLKKGVKIPFGMLIEILNKFYKGNAVEWLTKFANDLPKKHATSMKKMLREILVDLRAKLQTLATRLPGSLGKKAQDAVDSIGEVTKIADDKIDEAARELQEGLNKSLGEGVDFERKGATKELNTRQQTATDPPDAPEPEPTVPKPQKPSRPLRPPNSRHKLGKKGIKHSDKNTVVEPHIDMDKDIAAINEGQGRRVFAEDDPSLTPGGEYWEVNGRTYQLKPDGGTFPVKGDGVHTLSRAEYEALQQLIKNGEKAPEIFKSPHIKPEDWAKALELYRLIPE